MPDWEERGNLDKLREDIENDLGYRAPSDRAGHSLRTDFYREDANHRFARSRNQRRTSTMGRIFEIGLTVAGSIAAYKFLHKTPAGIELAEEFAKAGRFVRKGWNKVLHTVLNASAPTDPRARAMLQDLRETGTSHLGKVSRISRLEDAVKVVEHHRQFGHDVMHTDLGRALQDSFKAQASAPSGYLALTAGDVLVNRSTRGLVGRNQASILEKALDFGLITREMHLGHGLVRKGNLPVVRGVRDTRGLMLKTLGQGIENLLDKIQVPIINWKMSSIIRTPRAILGKHKGVTAIPGGAVVPGRGAGTTRIAQGGSYLVDGKLLIQDALGGYQQVAEGLKPIFRREHKDLFRVGGAMYGQFKEPEFNQGIMGWLERTLGVGKAYQTERSIFSSLFLDPIKRLARGRTVVKDEIRRKAVSRAPTTAAIDHLLESGGYVSKEYGMVPNIYGDVAEINPTRRFFDKVRAAYGKGKFVKYQGRGVDGGIKGVELPKPGTGFPGSEAMLLPQEHKWNMLANWLSMRPADLMSYTTGIAYKPGSGLHGYTKNIARLYGIWYGANLGLEAAKYLDYQMEDLTGVSPFKAAASGYVGLRLFQKAAADTLGITQAAQYMEDLMPLSMTSTASGLARATLPGLLGGVVAGPTGLAIGLGASALMGGLASVFWPEDIIKTADEYQEEISGERKVPVRANRWWEFNNEEFSGGRIKYFKPHWYSELMSDYQFSDVKYGSKENYWKKVSTLPTPSNWFGLRSDKAWLGKRHATDRPYPYVAGEPIPGMGAASSGYLQAGAGADALSIGVPDDLQSKFNKIYESGTEFLGLYKFLGESILGIQAPFKHENAWASSEEMTSLHHAFWESDMGGLGGMTELLRRFILPRNALPNSYNPLPNLMPNWLPGERAIFNSDQRYFLNFHKGDPYRAVPHGEYRLPGPGYEALHRMHSGQPGVYDAMDRYQILADVAPYSRAFSHYRTIVRSWQKAGVLDEFWTRQFQLTEAEVDAKREGGRYVQRKFTGHDRNIQSINEATKYTGFEKAVGGAWEYAVHDIASTIPILGTKLLRARTPYKAYMEEQVYGETFKNWADPYGSFIRPHFQMAIADDPLSGAGRGSMAMYLGANPISKAVLGLVGAAIGGLGSAGRAAATGQIEGGWVPGYKEEEWDTLEYMDRLQYVRAKRLQGIAAMEGNAADALRWKQEAERTMTGLPAGASVGQMQAAMPPHLKKYMRGLLETEPGAREEILGVLPQHIRPAFSRMWGMGQEGLTPEQTAADYFSRHELPESNWLGWHPSVPFGVSKIKIADTAEGSQSTRLHHYGLWESQLTNYHMIYSAMEAPIPRLESMSMDDAATRDALLQELNGINKMSGSVRRRWGYGGIHMNFKLDNSQRLRDHTDSFMRGF